MREVLYSALYPSGYPFDRLAKKLETVRCPVELKEPDSYLVIWGGEDISPSLYGEKPNKFCGAMEVPSRRDLLEKALILRAVELNIPIIGICRGAQLACALMGGKVIQHVEGHGRSHLICTETGETMITSSMHHQMMSPSGTNHQLIAWTYPKSMSEVYIGENEEFVSMEVEPEIVLWPDKKILGIQGHPEFMHEVNRFVSYCCELVEKNCD